MGVEEASNGKNILCAVLDLRHILDASMTQYKHRSDFVSVDSDT